MSGAWNGLMLAALVVGLAVALVLLFWIFRKIAGTGGSGLGRHRRHRLAIVEAARVDGKRRLVLVRRDDVEHLVMIGGGSDVLVESGIRPEPVPEVGPAEGFEADAMPATAGGGPVLAGYTSSRLKSEFEEEELLAAEESFDAAPADEVRMPPDRPGRHEEQNESAPQLSSGDEDDAFGTADAARDTDFRRRDLDEPLEEALEAELEPAERRRAPDRAPPISVETPAMQQGGDAPAGDSRRQNRSADIEDEMQRLLDQLSSTQKD